MTHYNPNLGFEHPFYPGYKNAFDSCSCVEMNACGNEHKPSVMSAMSSRSSNSSERQEIKSMGKIYQNAANKPFAVWDGHLALHDLNPPKPFKYIPPPMHSQVNDQGTMSDCLGPY